MKASKVGWSVLTYQLLEGLIWLLGSWILPPLFIQFLMWVGKGLFNLSADPDSGRCSDCGIFLSLMCDPVGRTCFCDNFSVSYLALPFLQEMCDPGLGPTVDPRTWWSPVCGGSLVYGLWLAAAVGSDLRTVAASAGNHTGIIAPGGQGHHPVCMNDAYLVCIFWNEQTD